MRDDGGVHEDDEKVVKDEVMPEGKWKFDAEVSECFEDMLKRCVPQYDVMRQAVRDVAVKYAVPGTDVLDLGCSRGDCIESMFGTANTERCRFVGLEVSKPMIEICREKFSKDIVSGCVSIREHDLRGGLPQDLSPSVVTSILTMMFIPIEHRQHIFTSVYEKLRPGGALIMVEKVLGFTSEIDKVMVDIYYSMKRYNGYSEEQIQRKRLSLEGSLVPVTAAWNEQFLKSSGFDQVDCFWRWMNFCAWVAVKKR